MKNLPALSTRIFSSPRKKGNETRKLSDMDTTREGKVKLEEEGGVNKNPPFQFLRYDHLSNFRFFAFKAKRISTFGYFILISFGY